MWSFLNKQEVKTSAGYLFKKLQLAVAAAQPGIAIRISDCCGNELFLKSDSVEYSSSKCNHTYFLLLQYCLRCCVCWWLSG